MTLAVGSAGGSAVAPGRFGYQGRMDLAPEAPTRLYEAGAREYAPGLGTFTALDPVIGRALDPRSMHRYLYAHANPATLVDPDGHAAWCNTEYDGCSLAAYNPARQGPRVTNEPSALSPAEREALSEMIRREIARNLRRAAMAREPDRRLYDGDAILGYRQGPVRGLLAEAFVALGAFEARYDRERQQSTLPDVVGGVDPADVARLRAINAALGSLRLAGDHAGADTLFRTQQRIVPTGYGMAAASDWTEILVGAIATLGLGGDKIGPGPTRTLPRSRHGDPLPDAAYPHTQLGVRTTSSGTYRQARQWERDPATGQLVPTRDIDFTDHGYPAAHANPHQHRLSPNNPGLAPRGGYVRGTAEPLESGWLRY